MQLITLTAPDGHRERWDSALLVNALDQLYSYLIDLNQDKISTLAQQVEEFVGNNPSRVRSALVYAQSVKDGTFQKLALISNNGERNMNRIFFLLRSLDQDSGIYRGEDGKSADDNNMISMIRQVAGHDQKTIKSLAALAQLYIEDNSLGE
jgi:hypothetical protein